MKNRLFILTDITQLLGQQQVTKIKLRCNKKRQPQSRGQGSAPILTLACKRHFDDVVGNQCVDIGTAPWCRNKAVHYSAMVELLRQSVIKKRPCLLQFANAHKKAGKLDGHASRQICAAQLRAALLRLVIKPEIFCHQHDVELHMCR